MYTKVAELLPWIYSKMEVRAQCGHGTKQAGGTEVGCLGEGPGLPQGLGRGPLIPQVWGCAEVQKSGTEPGAAITPTPAAYFLFLPQNRAQGAGEGWS